MTAVRLRVSSAPVTEIVHVSACLREDGGGAARFGRVLGRALRRFASRHGLAFRGLHLPASDGHPALDGYGSFGGSRTRLALAVARLQIGGARSRRLVFDHPGPARVEGWLPRGARSPFAVALLGIDAWRALERDRRAALAGAAVTFAISATTRARASRYLPAGVPVEVVHPGIEDGTDGGAADARILATAGAGFVLMVGRLATGERYKGHDEVLEAWPRVAATRQGARLVVVGDGDDRARLSAKAQALGLAGSIVFTGRVDAATRGELYRRASLFALPSRDEGFGLVFLEAMAAARPCVALAGTAPAEIVVDGETGRLVPDGDREALAAALVELLGDPERARRMGAAGRARYDSEFTFAAFERRLEPLLERLAGAGAD